jgi:hypothetical protein
VTRASNVGVQLQRAFDAVEAHDRWWRSRIPVGTFARLFVSVATGRRYPKAAQKAAQW